MEDNQMVPRIEYERQLELARQEKEAAVLQAVDSVEKQVKLQLNMRDTDVARLSVIKKAVADTPDKPVKEVWDEADLTRPTPGTNTGARYLDDAAKLEDLQTQVETLQAEKERQNVDHEHELAGITERYEENKARLEEKTKHRIDSMKKSLTEQLHDGREKQRDEIQKQLSEHHATLENDLQAEIWRLQTALNTLNVEKSDQDVETMLPVGSMDIPRLAAPLDVLSQKSQASHFARLKSRSGPDWTIPILTADMSAWTLSPEQARQLIKSNKTINDIFKANISARVDQRTWPLKATIAQKEKENANLKLEVIRLCTVTANVEQLRNIAESKIASIKKSVLETPARPVEEVWAAVIGDRPVQLLHRTKPRSEGICFSTSLVAVSVGSPATVFNVSQKILCAASEFFAMALKKQWHEGQTNIVSLPDDNSLTFHVWLNWIYRHHIVLGLNAEESMLTSDFTSTSARGQKTWSSLVEAYALGDKLLDGDFKDAVVDSMAVLIFSLDGAKRWLPSSSQRTELFHATIEGSTARKLLVHLMARARQFLTVDDDHTLMYEVAKLTLDSNTPFSTLSAAAGCEFHEHKPGEMNCYRTKYSVESTFSW